MTCGKFYYPSYQEARKVARRQMDMARRHTGRRVHTTEPYTCQLCNSIHLTSHSEPKLKAV
jgi:predicted N-formylglutamate amidohydrolase